MDRPRHPRPPRQKRRDPQRTGPIRNAGEAWRDDTVSRGVREGYRVIDEQIRRGHRMAQSLDDDGRNDCNDHRRPYRERRREDRRGYNLLEMPMRHIERLTREILHQLGSGRPNPLRLAELVLRLQLEAFSELARLGFSALGGFSSRERDRDYLEEDADRMDRDIDETYGEIEEEIWEEEEIEAWDWPPAPSSPTTIRSTVPIPVYVSSHERTEINLDLPAGSQSLELEVERPTVSPAFEAEMVALADGPPILRIEIPRDLPAGRYLRRILVRATGEPVGDLTVQVGSIPKTAPKTAPAPKAPRKATPKARIR